jgi:hypothetical protein
VTGRVGDAHPRTLLLEQVEELPLKHLCPALPIEEPSDEVWKLTAPTVSIFFWDLAQTGLAWYREAGFEGGPPTRETDIGPAVA